MHWHWHGKHLGKTLVFGSRKLEHLMKATTSLGNISFPLSAIEFKPSSGALRMLSPATLAGPRPLPYMFEWLVVDICCLFLYPCIARLDLSAYCMVLDLAQATHTLAQRVEQHTLTHTHTHAYMHIYTHNRERATDHLKDGMILFGFL